MRRIGEGGAPRGKKRKTEEEKFPKGSNAAAAKVAIEFLTGELVEQARKSIVEERELKKPGPEFELFRKMVERTIGKDAPTTGLILMSRLAFLLTGAQELLAQNGIDNIILEDIEFEDRSKDS